MVFTLNRLRFIASSSSMRENVVQSKSFNFAIGVVEAYKILSQQKKEFVMSKQLLRSGTAVGAIIREAEQAESPADFIHKMSMSLKEAQETDYWLDLLSQTQFIDLPSLTNLKFKLDEIIRLLTAIIKTSKQNHRK